MMLLSSSGRLCPLEATEHRGERRVESTERRGERRVSVVTVLAAAATFSNCLGFGFDCCSLLNPAVRKTRCSSGCSATCRLPLDLALVPGRGCEAALALA